MTTVCMPTTSATGRDRRSPTRPETGRGHASLWTAAAAPDHKLWTTLRGPLDPSRLPTCPLPRRRRRASRYLSITPIKRSDELTTYATAPVAETALVNIDGPKTGGPFPSIKLGHTGLSNARGLRAPQRDVQQGARGRHVDLAGGLQGAAPPQGQLVWAGLDRRDQRRGADCVAVDQHLRVRRPGGGLQRDTAIERRGATALARYERAIRTERKRGGDMGGVATSQQPCGPGRAGDRDDGQRAERGRPQDTRQRAPEGRDRPARAVVITTPR